MKTKQDNSLIYRLIAIVAIDAVIVTMLWPVLPGIAAQSDNPGSTIALLTIILTGGQLISSPVLGYFSDRYGRRPIFILAALATLFSTILWLPRKLPLLFINHGTDGLSNGLYAVVRSTIADITTKKNRAKFIGIVDTLSFAGFVLGPMIAAVVLWVASQIELDSTTSLVITAATFAIVNVGFALTIPETMGESKAQQEAGDGGVKQALFKGLSPIRIYKLILELRERSPIAARLVLAEILVNFGTAGYTYYLIFISVGPLQFDERGISLFFLGFALPAVIFQSIFYQFVLHRIRRIRALIFTSLGGAAVLAFGYPAIGDSVTMLAIVLLFDLLTLFFVPALIEGYRAEHIPDDIQGVVQGVTQSLASASIIVSTLIYGVLLQFSLNVPFYWFAANFLAIAVLMIPLLSQDKTIDELHSTK